MKKRKNNRIYGSETIEYDKGQSESEEHLK